ncbi:uncharacterized protein [Diabrotica undecimpunctata]|uniref:uncharacterized protein n=1 Tax=Diabrotica undecimpunctata TaxID=50387 RepID=UPI003B637960
MVDFEGAVIQALKTIFPDVRLHRCNYHFNQSLWRNIQSIGLTTQYINDDNVRLHLRMCFALAYLPLEQIEDGWQIIQPVSPEDENLTTFYGYFVNECLENLVISINMLNCHGIRHQTNNAVEGWKNRLNRMLKKPHPNI